MLFVTTSCIDEISQKKDHKNVITRIPSESYIFKRAIQNVTVRASLKPWPKVTMFSFVIILLTTHSILTIYVPLTSL